MKKYIKPIATEVMIDSSAILADSVGLEDGNIPGKEYNPSDPSYGKHGAGDWEDWEDEYEE